MEIVKRELIRHSLLITKATETIYSNPNHLRGTEAYYDKKKLWELSQWVRSERQLMTSNDLQFLETILQKYSF